VGGEDRATKIPTTFQTEPKGVRGMKHLRAFALGFIVAWTPAVSASKIDLAWTASADNVGVTDYDIYRIGTQVGTSATSSYSHTGLTAFTQYTYTGEAAGNDNSASASATTPGSGGGGGIDESILPAMYQTVWNPGIPGGIPADNDPVRPATVWLPPGNPYNGYSVNPALTGVANAAAFSAAFQAAINSAGAAATPTSRKIVFLKAGTYFVNPQVNNGGQVGIVVQVDNVTVRGESPTTTSIVANGQINDYGTVILFGHRYGSSSADFLVRNVTADALKGAVTIQLSDASGYQVGDVITIDHVDGAASAVGPVFFNGGYLWNYDAQYFKRQPTYGWSGPSTGAPAFPDVTDIPSTNAAAQNVVPQWRSTVQENEITAINGNTITVMDPLNVDFPLSLSPQIWRTVPMNDASTSVGNRWVGLEDIRVAGGNNLWGFPGGNIALSYVAYGWVKGVDADGERWTSDPVNHPGKYGYNIGLARCYRCVVRESYAHGSTDENPGGQAYGIVVGTGSSADLIEDNISINNNKPIALNETGGGNVIAYNYVDQSALWNSPGWLENGIDDSHASFTHNDLIEGNWANNIGSDTTHGNSGWQVHLRNYSNGNNLLGGPMSANLRAVGMDAWSGYSAFIGNVLMGGTVYQTTPTSQNGTPIYQLGNNAPYGGWDNGYALAHIYRDGNWDNVTNGVVWAASARAIPNSFYLTFKPAFFGNNQWPWVDPVAGLTHTLPAKARYDAGTPFVVASPTRAHDFNSDGKSDIVWRDISGNVAIWDINGTQILNPTATFVANVTYPLWTIIGLGDFNGDGYSDILWRDTSGDLALWEMNGTRVLNPTATFVATVPGWSVVGTGDFNGDGMSDILWTNGNGVYAIWEMNGTQVLNPTATAVASVATTWSVQLPLGE
jgi:FG-GAP-like repeat